jgi:hypothetical protein
VDTHLTKKRRYIIFWCFGGDRKGGCGRLRDMVVDTHLTKKRRYILPERCIVDNKIYNDEIRLLGPNNMPRY